MNPTPPLTAAQHRAAVERSGDNLALRSGAGCGKTFVLARRFTELLMRDPGAADPLSRLVALTFTDKAALEMAQRVRRFLSETAARAKGDDRRRLLEWLEGVDEARVSTIHSFCAALLRGAAVEAGIDPAFTVCSDELLSAQMSAEAAEQAVIEAIEQQQEDVAALVLRGSLDPLIQRVCTLVEKRTAADLADYGNPQATLRRWGELVEQQREQATSELQADQ
ncbi:MAG: UvrD-helicase domain-containing protein, partial [Phycisphaerae bacterium]|nr:UvrD-helicase domain-containing protein [Phycisphaerae bacterium]